jgi:hypothetical protein
MIRFDGKFMSRGNILLINNEDDYVICQRVL